MCDYFKANNAEYFNVYTAREHNIPLFSPETFNKGFQTSPINFKRIIGLKITLVKFTYPKG